MNEIYEKCLKIEKKVNKKSKEYNEKYKFVFNWGDDYCDTPYFLFYDDTENFSGNFVEVKYEILEKKFHIKKLKFMEYDQLKTILDLIENEIKKELGE